jgi:hypothetical protein
LQKASQKVMIDWVNRLCSHDSGWCWWVTHPLQLTWTRSCLYIAAWVRCRYWVAAMAKDILGEAELHLDELNTLWMLVPEVTQQTIELKEECKDFFGQNWPISENSW